MCKNDTSIQTWNIKKKHPTQDKIHAQDSWMGEKGEKQEFSLMKSEANSQLQSIAKTKEQKRSTDIYKRLLFIELA